VTSLNRLLKHIRLLRSEHSKTYQRVWFDIPLLRQPAWQQITLLPESYQRIHEDNIKYMMDHHEQIGPKQVTGTGLDFSLFKDFEIQKMQRNLAYWRKHQEKDSAQKKNFYAFFAEHDRRRGTSFEQTFPEMQEFWQECKSL